MPSSCLGYFCRCPRQKKSVEFYTQNSYLTTTLTTTVLYGVAVQVDIVQTGKF